MTKINDKKTINLLKNYNKILKSAEINKTNSEDINNLQRAIESLPYYQQSVIMEKFIYCSSWNSICEEYGYSKKECLELYLDAVDLIAVSFIHYGYNIF